LPLPLACVPVLRRQARRLVFATFTGSWEEAHRDVLVPHFRKANGNAEIALDRCCPVDQIAKVTAARANPPIDVMLHDPGPALTAIAQDLVEPFPVAGSKHYGDLCRWRRSRWGRRSSSAVGITYNPDKVKTPAKSGTTCGSRSSRAASASPT